MSTLVEMTKDLVVSHIKNQPLTTDELLAEIKKVYLALQSLEGGVPAALPEVEIKIEEPAPQLTLKQAFKKDEVVCMICGKGEMQTLTRHLNQAHGIKHSEYRKQFNISKSQHLMSKSYAAKRKEIAAGMDLGANLEKARAVRKGNIDDEKSKLPVVMAKAPVPATRSKAAVPAVKKTAAVPAKSDKN